MEKRKGVREVTRTSVRRLAPEFVHLRTILPFDSLQKEQLRRKRQVNQLDRS